MATYIGFSTVDVNQPQQLVRTGIYGGLGSTTYQPKIGRKFVLTDANLVIRDLLNALSIPRGSKVGQPNYGTLMWSYLFEPQNENTEELITNEIRRVMSEDPRISLNTLEVFAQDNGVLVQVEMAFSPYNQVVSVDFFLNKFDGSVQQLSQ